VEFPPDIIRIISYQPYAFFPYPLYMEPFHI